MNQKQLALNACIKTLQNRQNDLLQQIKSLNESLESEGKSSVGDKHETARARIQTEIEKFGNQLKLTETSLNELAALNPSLSAPTVQKGSYVITANASFFIGPALGKVETDAFSFFAISLASPLGQLLVGKACGDSISLNGSTYKIEKLE